LTKEREKGEIGRKKSSGAAMELLFGGVFVGLFAKRAKLLHDGQTDSQ
jgi:hypothetical protein